MLAVDTNVVVGTLVGDDPAQKQAALGRLGKIRADGGSVLAVLSVGAAEKGTRA